MSTDQQNQIHTFTAQSLREALAQVRAELGADALIIGQQQMGSRIAVRACLEVQQEPEQQSARPSIAESVVEELVVPESVALTADYDRQNKTFIDAGYDDSIIADFPGCTELQQLRRSVVNRLNYAHRSIASLRGFYRFVGAAGVGKSATLIKVLVEWVLRNGARDVVVVSSDNEQLAGTEGLQLTCQMLSVPMRECSASELPAVLTQLHSKGLVLVDSPAMELKRPIGAIGSLRDIWVCSALHGPANLAAQYAAVQSLRPIGVVPTQLDQVTAADPVANLLYRWRLPLYWLGTGSRLPDGIDQADEDTLFRNLFGAEQTVTLELAV
jgi:flagellar biosynthesis GTPase FlhF